MVEFGALVAQVSGDRYLLDNDISSYFLRDNVLVKARVLSVPKDRLWLSQIAAEEMLFEYQAILKECRDKKIPNGLVANGQSFERVIRHVARFEILPYTEEAEALRRSWPAWVKRVGFWDCATASLAIVSKMVVVTANIRHFSLIAEYASELRHVDWSK